MEDKKKRDKPEKENESKKTTKKSRRYILVEETKKTPYELFLQDKTSFADLLYESMAALKAKFPSFPKEAVARLTILSLAEYDKGKKPLEDCFSTVCYPVELPREPDLNQYPIPPLPAAAANTPTDADIVAAYKYLGQLGRAIGSWNSDIKRAIHYIGKLHESCHYVRNADLANTVNTAVNAAVTTAVTTAVNAAVTTAVTTAVNAAVSTAVNAAMGPFLRNQRAWNRNRKNCIAALGPLTAIEKTVPGVGLGLPTPPNNPGAAPPALAVGATPANFPGTFANLGSLGKKDIHQLAIQYNEDFGILAGDHVTVCRQKFQDWICGM